GRRRDRRHPAPTRATPRKTAARRARSARPHVSILKIRFGARHSPAFMSLFATIRSPCNTEKCAMPIEPFARILTALLCVRVLVNAQELRRATVWDLRLGEPAAAQPKPDEFRGFACGSNGGPPRLKLAGWSEFARCAAEPGGLREVYFEYDDE